MWYNNYMIIKNKFIFSALLVSGIFLGGNSSEAYQSQVILGEESIKIDSPETAKAFYGELSGRENSFKINSDTPFNLYVNILVPDVFGAREDFTVEISKDGKIVAVLNGANSQWKNFYEPFAGDNYWKGPEYNSSVEAGAYEIKIANPGQVGKYALVVGKTASLSPGATLQSIFLFPQIITYFFHESLFSAY